MLTKSVALDRDRQSIAIAVSLTMICGSLTLALLAVIG